MVPFFPYRLDCQDLLINEVVPQLQARWLNKNRGFTFSAIFSQSTLTILNSELMRRNLPRLAYTMCFARPAADQQAIHVDGTGALTHASLNIPLMGCENSVMEWFTGDYKLVRTDYIDQSGQSVYFQTVVWNSDYTVTHSLELTESHMVRVGVPHRTTANNTDSRAVLCLRFFGNPSWDQICFFGKSF